MSVVEIVGVAAGVTTIVGVILRVRERRSHKKAIRLELEQQCRALEQMRDIVQRQIAKVSIRFFTTSTRLLPVDDYQEFNRLKKILKGDILDEFELRLGRDINVNGITKAAEVRARLQRLKDGLNELIAGLCSHMGKHG